MLAAEYHHVLIVLAPCWGSHGAVRLRRPRPRFAVDPEGDRPILESWGTSGALPAGSRSGQNMGLLAFIPHMCVISEDWA